MATKRKRTTLTLDPAITAWMAHQAPRLRVGTIGKLGAHTARWLAEWGGNTSLQRITTAHIDRFLGKRLQKVSASTAALDRKILSGFFVWAERTGAVETNPVIGSSVPKIPDRTPRALSREEEIAVLAQLPPHWANMVAFAIETGLRVRTICELEWEYVDLERGWLRIPGHCLKSGRGLEVPMSLRAVEILKGVAMSHKRLQGRIWKTSLRTTIAHAFQSAVEAAGIPPCRFHDLRVTFFSRCRQRGVPIEVAMALCDHHSIKVALRVYRAVAEDEKLKAVGREGT